MKKQIILATLIMAGIVVAGCSQKAAPSPASSTTPQNAANVAPASTLTEPERRYLVWILLGRKEAKLPDVSIKHFKTITGACPGCLTILYQWGSPATTVRVTVENDAVKSAVDTSGYDYVAKTQGSPIVFDELRS